MKNVTESHAVKSRYTSVSNSIPLSGIFTVITSDVVKAILRRVVPLAPPSLTAIAGLPELEVVATI
jgi:hypothetical protein